jgi:hypothetical protein
VRGQGRGRLSGGDIVRQSLLLVAGLLVGLGLLVEEQYSGAADGPGAALSVGFAEADITPKLGDKPVFMAGFGKNRVATRVHDPLMARAVVLGHGEQKIALVSLDVVGFSLSNVERVRGRLPGFAYVLVSSTHNHEGPDTLGLWGPTPFQSGIDPDYMRFLEDQTVAVVQAAEKAARPATAKLGQTKAPELLHDGREPYVLHDDLVVLQFLNDSGSSRGLIVQWNCHPETLGSSNKEISADYVAATVEHLRKTHGGPVAYFTGTVGGLMTSLHVPIKDEQGKELADGTFAKTERYGRLLGEAADRALAKAKPITLTPFTVRSRPVFLPLDNKGYLMARRIGVLARAAFLWTGDPTKAEPVAADVHDKLLAIRTEVASLQLGELSVACIPGEIYPELVLDKVQDPPDPGADFPDAPIEPAVYKQMPGPHRMLIGLANDEIGYIIPKRQWDVKPPFCYGRNKAQYGEENSVGPETAPLLCEAFKSLLK